MKSKNLAPALSLIALLAVTGCNKKGSGGNTDKQGHFDHEVTIKFVQAYAQGYQPKLQEFVDSFKEIEPNVTINLEDGWISGNYDTIHSQTISDIQTGEYGDLVIAYPDHVVDYIDYGKAIQLEQYLDNAEYGWTAAEKEDVVPAYLREGQEFPLEGTYCLPFSKSTEAMFYNETRLFDPGLVSFLATKGISMNRAYIESLTWEELFGNLCPAFEEYDAAHPEAPLIQKKEGKFLNSYVGYDSDANLFITLTQQYGSGYTSVDEYGEAHLDFNNTENKNRMKIFANASAKGYLRSPAVIGESYSSGFFKDNNTLFSIGSTAGVKNQVATTFDVGVARIPQAAGKDPKIISQGPSICILSHGDADRELAAWLFYKHMTSAQNTARWAITVGYLPIRASAYTSEAYSDYCSTEGKDARSLELLTALNAIYSSSTVDMVFTTPPFKGSSTARSEIQSMMANILKDAANGTTVDDTYLNTCFDLAENNILKDM